MKAVFVELPAFERHRADYLDEAAFSLLQSELMRGKGKRGGLRVIYYWWGAGMQFWLYTLFDKDELDDLAPQQRKVLKAMLKAELELRRTK